MCLYYFICFLRGKLNIRSATNYMRKQKAKNSVNRMIFVILTFILQTAWVIIQFIKLNEYSTIIASITNIIAATVVVYVYVKEECSDVKLAWIMLILVFPVMGLALYLMYGTKRSTRTKYLKSEQINRELNNWTIQDQSLLHELENIDISVANQARYIFKYGQLPFYKNTDIEYYKDATDGFEAQLINLEKAEKFIFMEYHAIEDAESFARLKEVLARKAKAGVEV